MYIPWGGIQSWKQICIRERFCSFWIEQKWSVQTAFRNRTSQLGFPVGNTFRMNIDKLKASTCNPKLRWALILLRYRTLVHFTNAVTAQMVEWSAGLWDACTGPDDHWRPRTYFHAFAESSVKRSTYWRRIVCLVCLRHYDLYVVGSGYFCKV